MSPYFIIIPEGRNFGKVYAIRDGQWYNIAASGKGTKVEILTRDMVDVAKLV